MLPTFKSCTVHKIIEYLTLGLLSSLWNISHSTAYFFDLPCILSIVWLKSKVLKPKSHNVEIKCNGLFEGGWVHIHNKPIQMKFACRRPIHALWVSYLTPILALTGDGSLAQTAQTSKIATMFMWVYSVKFGVRMHMSNYSRGARRPTDNNCLRLALEW